MNDAAFLAAYERSTSGALEVALEDWSTLRVAGRDRVAFLQKFCTNDLRGLTEGDQSEAFFCDAKGKIVAHGFLFFGSDAVMLVGTRGTASRLASHLDRYIIREDVQLTDESVSRQWALQVGPRAAELVRAGKPDRSALAESDVWLAPCRELWTGALWRTFEARNSATDAEGAHAAWQALRIESGWPLFAVDFDDTNLPQEVGRDDKAISFSKGCYLGQETVARLDALGHVNKRLALVQLDAEDAKVGSELQANDQIVGRLSSACWSPHFNSRLGLAMLRRGSFGVGTSLSCQGRPAEVVAPATFAL